MTTKKTTTIMLAIALALGFAACKNGDITENPQNGDTYVGVTLTMNIVPGSSTRALPEDYNNLGKWAGKDNIASIAVYLVDGTTVTSNVFTLADFTVGTPDAAGIKITPKKAIKTTTGSKKVYALINGTTEVTTYLQKTPASEFEKAYKNEALKLASAGSATVAASTSASKLATKNGVINEQIVMTNSADASVDVQAGVTEAEAIANDTKNRAKINVERTVTRVMVTVAKNTPFDVVANGVTIGTISNVKYVAAQGENSFYVQRKATWETPASAFKPADDAAFNAAAGAWDKYDYSGLWESFVATDAVSGTTVPTMATYGASDPEKLTNITAQLNAQLSGKFLLPNTHLVNADRTASGFKKGNTAYVLVRAQFTPTSLADGVGYTADTDFYMGENGKFYSNEANAQNPATGGVTAQKVARYIKGKVLYFAWLNPDAVDAPINSPSLRNNVYHIHITGFKQVGLNWNPLVPVDEAGGGNTTNNPRNPDAKPGTSANPTTPNPNEPDSPVKPSDPLSHESTWMSVEMTVLPWTMHSYGIDLGNNF